MTKDILTLPFAIQIALGAGYLAYLTAYAGIRQHHTATDAFFRALAFGLAASGVVYFAPRSRCSIALAVGAPVLLAALWRWRGMALAKALLRKWQVSWADDIPTAWLSLVAEDAQARPSQISVDLDNGHTVVCDDTRLFADAPHGPCKFGLDGGVAMYVTAERRLNGEWFEHEDVRNSIDGDRITYLPADAIKRVEIRFWTKANATVWKGEAQ